MTDPSELARPTARAHIGAHTLAPLLGHWDATGSAYTALASRLRLLIIDGRIPSHTRLPSERELAAAVGRSRSTVVAAYRALRDEGYLVSIRGSGSIARLAPADIHGVDPPVVDFARAAPAPVAALGDVIARAAATAPAAITHAGVDMLGEESLRVRIAERFVRRGLPTRPDQIMVTLGAQHAIALIARTLLAPGSRVLVESPSYPHALQAFRDAGARILGTPVTSQGWDLDHAAGVLDRLRPVLAYLMPDFHNPSGGSIPDTQRAQLAHGARRTGTLLLVDETTAELDIDGIGSAGEIATQAGDSVIIVGSLSKTVWGGFRIGWIRADPGMLTRLAARRPAGDLGTPVIEQLMAASVLDDLDQLLAERLAQLRGQRDLVIRLLRSQLPDWHVPSVAGGLCLWVGLGTPLSSRLAAACQRQGLRISAGPTFGTDGAHERFIRVPFTAGPEHLTAGVSILRDTWDRVCDGRRRGGRLAPLPHTL
ncbi:PLP-dependent aminotransferase family protein [Mycobacterium sp. smrl_JER01]|uniref:MocR-like transcription factor YczR n=1 Tax=Mycobacterium sp. smrl_JER01 TaxID=3402633 RepID=UPI003AC5777C